jgi:hypothetical protein
VDEGNRARKSEVSFVHRALIFILERAT